MTFPFLWADICLKTLSQFGRPAFVRVFSPVIKSRLDWKKRGCFSIWPINSIFNHFDLTPHQERIERRRNKSPTVTVLLTPPGRVPSSLLRTSDFAWLRVFFCVGDVNKEGCCESISPSYSLSWRITIVAKNVAYNIVIGRLWLDCLTEKKLEILQKKFPKKLVHKNVPWTKCYFTYYGHTIH